MGKKQAKGAENDANDVTAAAQKLNVRPKSTGNAGNKTTASKIALDDEFSEESLMMKLRGDRLSHILKSRDYDNAERKDSADSIVKRPPVSWQVGNPHAPREDEIVIVSTLFSSFFSHKSVRSRFFFFSKKLLIKVSLAHGVFPSFLHPRVNQLFKDIKKIYSRPDVSTKMNC